MPVPVREMICIRALRGSTVHITSLSTPGRTACNKKCNGWKVAPVSKPYESRVSCDACKRAIFLKVQRNPRGR